MSGLLCRLLFDPPGAGAWNMAVDETLLDSAATGRATLRFYTWQEETLSLGYFQRWKALAVHPCSASLPVVRRPSGGGAILHGTDLTYALALPVSPWLRSKTRALYLDVHQALVNALLRLGVSACLAAAGDGEDSGNRTFLCMGNISAGDVLVGGVKVAGSAQRRRGAGVLQHGSVQLRPAQRAAELVEAVHAHHQGDMYAAVAYSPGVAGLGGPTLDPTELATHWSQQISNCLELGLMAACMDPEEYQLAQRLACERYLAPGWTFRA